MAETRVCFQYMSCHFVFPRIASDVSFHNIFAFIVTVLLALLQLIDQGNASDSLFEEHPITVRFATGCLLVYCLLYAVEKVEPSGNAGTHRSFVLHFQFLFGSLSIASLASIIFPSSFRPFLYGICIIVFVDRRQLLFNTIAMFINLVYVSIKSRIITLTDQGSILPV